MIETLNEIESEASSRLVRASTSEDLEAWWRATLGRKGEVQLLTRRLRHGMQAACRRSCRQALEGRNWDGRPVVRGLGAHGLIGGDR